MIIIKICGRGLGDGFAVIVGTDESHTGNGHDAMLRWNNGRILKTIDGKTRWLVYIMKMYYYKFLFSVVFSLSLSLFIINLFEFFAEKKFVNNTFNK